MKEQEIEESLKEDFLDRHEATTKEASSFAHDTVLGILSDLDSFDEDLEALDEFQELLDLNKNTVR